MGSSWLGGQNISKLGKLKGKDWYYLHSQLWSSQLFDDQRLSECLKPVHMNKQYREPTKCHTVNIVNMKIDI